MARQMTTAQAADILGVPTPLVRRYARAAGLGKEGTTPGHYRFDLREMGVLRALVKLAAHGVSPGRIRRVAESLKKKNPGPDPFSGVALAADQGRVVARRDGRAWDAETGQGLLGLNDAPEAKVLRFRPATAEPDDQAPPTAADGWVDLGLSLEEDDPVGAYSAFLEALAQDPEHVEAMINLGRLCAQGGDPARGAAYFRQALRVDGEQPVARFNLGLIFHEEGLIEDAAREYRRAIAADPDFADAHYNLAVLLEQAGESGIAAEHMAAYYRVCGHPELP